MSGDPRHRAQKKKAKELLARVREALMREWDPIGVSDEPNAQDEYDRYAMRMCSRLLDAASTEAEIAVYLAHIEGAWMGLHPPKRAAIDRTVDALMALKREFAAW
jgi:hypothetical protein